jgi:hypothetical protein
MDGTDRSVVAGQQPGQGTLIHQVALGRRDAGLGRDFLRATGDRGDGMPAPGKLGDDARAGISRRADNGDFHATLQAKIGFLLVSNGY